MSTATNVSVTGAQIVSHATAQESTLVVSTAGVLGLQDATNAATVIARTKIDFFIFLFLFLIVKHNIRYLSHICGLGEIRTLVQIKYFNKFIYKLSRVFLNKQNNQFFGSLEKLIKTVQPDKSGLLHCLCPSVPRIDTPR